MEMATQDRPGVEERYQTAGNTSDLSVKAERGGAGDVMIAAGWSASRVGMALLRLHSEWDGAAKPKRPTLAMVQAIADRLKADDEQARTRWGPPNPKARKPGDVGLRAQSEAALWYSRELRLLAQGLKARAVVLEKIHAWALVKDIPSDHVGPALYHWLSPTCPVCDGHGLRKLPDAPTLGAKQCHACNGTGQMPRPADAGRIQSWLDDCCQKARTSLKNRLRPE